MQLSIIIPAYNEEKRLPLTLERIIEYLSIHYQGDYEIIVADDGSTDGTTQIVSTFMKRHPELHLLKLAQNRGRGAAVRDAVFQAKGEFILETDADGSVNEHAIIDFLNYFAKHPEVDALTGSRLIEGSRILTPQPFSRKILGYSFFFLTKIFFGWPVTDRINGFKMYRREAALDIFKYQYENGFLSKAEAVYIAEARGWTVKELPVLWTEHSGSKVRPLRDSWDSFLGLFRILARSRKGLYKQNLVNTRAQKTSTKIQKKSYQSMLVTGGCGFIGSNFIRYFYNKYPETKIVNLDLLTYAGNLDNLKDIEGEERYVFVRGDICDELLLDQLFGEHRFDLVVHFAAESHVDRSIFSMADFVRTNIEGTRALIEAARRHRAKRFIHISTDEVYGSIKNGYAREDWPLRPSNPYSASKAGADHLVQAYIRTHELPAVIIRGSNNYGPYQYPEKLIPLTITNLLEGQKIPVHGYGIHVRSWLHVHDFCRAIDLLAHNQPADTVYNVAGEEKTNTEILEMIATYLGKSFEDWRFHVTDRPGADHRYAVDDSRLCREFDWQLTHNTFAEHLREVVKWYMENQEWWKKIKQVEDFQKHYERQAKGQWT